MNKTAKDGPQVGKAIDRVDGRLKVSGKAKYAADYPMNKLAHAVLLQSTICRGKIKSVDSSKAEKLPGVLAVITYKNAPKIPPKPQPDFDDSLHLLQDNKIYHDRQTIGIVVADTLETARHAAAMVEFEYEKQAPEVNMEAFLSKAKYAENKKNSEKKRGDWKKGYGSGVARIEATYVTPAEIHSMMEPHATTAYWDGDSLQVWESTQAIFNTRNKIAKAFGVPPSKVRVIAEFLGGGFGTKLSTWSGTILCVLAAKQTKRPVRLALTRENTFGGTGNRPRTVQTLSLAADKTGRLTALRHECISENCRFTDFTEDGADISNRLYSCPNVFTSTKTVALDLGKPTWMRAPGECPGVYAIECAMDELAHAAKIDPLKLRQINHAEKDESVNLPWSSNWLKECYEQGSRRFGWEQRKLEPRSMKKGKNLVGWGMATACHPVFRMKTEAAVTLNPDGSATVLSGTQDIGTGTYTVATQIAADALGLPIEKVHFSLGDTNMPEAPLSGGSMTAAAAGSAVLEVCQKAIKNLAELAVADKNSPLFGAKADELVAQNEGLYLKSNTEKGESFSSILKRQTLGKLEVKGAAVPDAKALEKYSKYTFGAHFAEVEIDPELGTVRVTKFVSAVAAGKIINPKTAANQIKGGVIFGIGMALTEEIVRDQASGRILNADLAEYHIPVHADIPDIDVIFVGEPDPIINPLGSKGIGEVSVIGVAAAVANAIFHASGKRVRDLPITLDKIL